MGFRHTLLLIAVGVVTTAMVLFFRYGFDFLAERWGEDSDGSES